jgi:PGF-CTERM protein
MRTTTFIAVAALALAAVAAAGGAAAGGAATTGHDNGIGANYTVALPSEEDHYPGTQGGAASIYHLAAAGDAFEKTSSPEGLKRMDTLTISNQDVGFGSCSTENTAAFGLDYGNNDSGTTTNEPLLKHRENSAFNEHSIYVDFYGPDSLAGSPVRFKAIDQIVAVQQDCYQMPSEPGWYQINARINGTGYNGEYIDTKDEGTIRSHYFYVCECSSRSEAESKLGPPPSEESDSGGSGGSSTATPTPTATATPTPTPTATATPTPTPEPDDSGGSSTATPTATDTSGGGGSGGTTATATAAAGGNTNAGGSQQGGAPATPTVGAGPGFGAVAALGALLGAALLAFRRN